LKSKLLFSFKILITLSAFYLLHATVQDRISHGIILPQPTAADLFFLTSVLLLMPVNWLLEARQWQLLTWQKHRFSLFSSYEIVLQGILFNWIIPFTGGDVLARLQPMHDKLAAGKALLINRATSSIVTATFFIIGGTYYFFGSKYLDYATVAVLSVFLISYFIFQRHRRVFTLSIARYVVFSLQLAILFAVFVPSLDVFAVIAAISWIFFFRTFVPSLFGALGIRELSAVMFFDAMTINPAPVILATLILWLVNIVIPSLAGGLVFSFSHKKMATA
jgi:hypothetical protein